MAHIAKKIKIVRIDYAIYFCQRVCKRKNFFAPQTRLQVSKKNHPFNTRGRAKNTLFGEIFTG
ncbi:MAG: hypothetical protein LBQ66_16645, partial [Planctomycetaceae bacterium]|nr:hypothetical protein [Planctomycetaceae bacterium]